ncbi:hypothetical protein Q1695_015504 [Nippostrongylus brasiliensis]|nr:hypothetical protein Q1695_015504 [Nippostrongylus brasiliensis]
MIAAVQIILLLVLCAVFCFKAKPVKPQPKNRVIAGGTKIPSKSVSVETAEMNVSTARSFPTTPKLESQKPDATQLSVGAADIKEQTKKQEFLPYPDVREMTKSQKKRRKRELALSKKKKIASGFYQPRSDTDDTLEKVPSLPREESERELLKSIQKLKSIIPSKKHG